MGAIIDAHDPSVGENAATSPALLRRKEMMTL